MRNVLLTHARAMRREPTLPERVLWAALRRTQLADLKFRRQVPIGRFIVDFYCSQARLVVEVDGDAHLDPSVDAARDDWMRAQGITVLRFTNGDVLVNLSGVLEAILVAVSTPPPTPSHKGRGLRDHSRHRSIC